MKTRVRKSPRRVLLTPEEENRRLREMCKKYLAWLHVEDPEKGLKKDLYNPEMWS